MNDLHLERDLDKQMNPGAWPVAVVDELEVVI